MLSERFTIRFPSLADLRAASRIFTTMRLRRLVNQTYQIISAPNVIDKYTSSDVNNR
ncbi:hypothetical protein SAMN05518672_104551 [Chitinophaga sp. CF118]|nr:hypothetical protein SAMN05518672_104551 [Chitinophaga sp. CF118]